MYVSEELIIVDGYNIEVLDNHQSVGKTLFVFHGNSSSASSAKGLYTTKLADNNRIISCSLLGHGKSSPANNPKDEYSIKGIGECIQKILNYYNLPEYYLVGQSVSGHAIIESYEKYPNCKGIVAISSPPINIDTLPHAFKQSPASSLLFKGDLTEEEVGLLSGEFTIYGENAKDIANGIKHTDPLFRISLGESVANGKLGDELASAKSITSPVLYIKSKEDKFLNDSYYSMLENEFNLPINVVSVKKSGHAVLLDNSNQCAEAIESFINI